ncbi:UNVERIFIED_CONTAM: hypothetical protein FKN15_036911 [Acipenser sinensis]
MDRNALAELLQALESRRDAEERRREERYTALIERAFRNAVMSTFWCTGKGDVIEDWCRCDLSAFDENGLPNCSPLLQPELRLAPNLEPSSTMVAMEWLDIEPVIGCKISDFIIQHKKVEDPLEAEIYTGVQLQMLIYC